MRPAPPRRLIAAVTIAALALLGAGCGGGDGGGSAAEDVPAGQVNVLDNRFVPETIEILPGETVTWDFQGATLHNVVGDGFKSENKRDGTFEHTFNSAGTYDYVCTLHPGMNGTVEVG